MGVATKKELYFHYKPKKLQFVTESILNDEYSKNLYLSAIINQISDNKGLLISFYYDHIWKFYDKLALCECSEKITANGGELILYDLSKINLADIKIYYSQFGILINYIIEQYAYRNLVRAKKGDYVIDGGACYGDTAFYFSHLVGEDGKVFSFEFVDENLEVFNKNMALNPHIKNIKIIKRPLYRDSNNIVSYSGVGGGAHINRNTQDKKSFKTISIDEFVEENRIPRIDFIKFDIEGSELEALKGAKNTLQKYRPRLAICLYHRLSDYIEIPLFLNAILKDYEFYFDHFTLGLWESVLFARPKSI